LLAKQDVLPVLIVTLAQVVALDSTLLKEILSVNKSVETEKDLF
jgi:hypothetical protein